MAEFLVDPDVSRAKFARELADYHSLELEYIQRGWWLVCEKFPEVFIVFGAPHSRPPAVAFGAVLDFTNYDLWPPSVRLVNPFTREPYRYRDLPTRLPRRLAAAQEGALGEEVPVSGVKEIALQEMMVGFGPDDLPFVCLPGVREYHDHPAHTGDSWFLHRRTGEGTLHFILDNLSRYGSEPLAVQVQVQIRSGPVAEKIPV